MIAGVLTAGELALLRTRPQRTLLYLAIPNYKTIYTARVNGAPTSNDKVFSIEFDGGAGTLTDAKPGMTLLVGTAAGAWDIGIARIRDDSLDTGGGTGYFFIGITSEIEWVDDLFLTVVDDFGLWPRHPYISAAVVYMDYGIVYTNQNQYGDPVPILGSHAVLELTGASVTTNFDGVDSYSCIGVPLSYSYAWTCSGAVVATPAASDTDITFNAAGTYLVKLAVTADYGGGITKSSIGYRYVIVYDSAHPLNTSFALDSCSGDFEGGGWSYRVTMNANAAEANIRDRTLCLLVAKDFYGNTEQSIGPLDGRENIVCVGWVDGESLRRSNDKSMVSFDVQGPHFWLEIQEGFPTGIDDTDAAPTDWSHIEELNPRKGLFSFLHWRTTSTSVMDCWITDDDHRLATTYTPAGSLLEQLRAIAERVNARTVCDRYGRLFCQIDTQFITPVLRTFPVVQTLTDRDWRDEITIERRTVGAVGQVDLSGVYYSGDLATSSVIFALSPGHIPMHYGEKRQIDRIALDDQAEADTVAGLWMGYFNNEYPHVDTPMSSNYRAVDIAPRMFVQMNLAAGDTPRGLTWTNKKLIPRDVSFIYDAREAVLLTDITFEAETFASDAVTGDPPIEPPDPPLPPAPPTVCNDPTALNFGMPGDCVYATTYAVVLVMNATQLGVSQDFYTAASPHWVNCKTGALAGPLIGQFRGAALSPTGDAWVITEGSLDADANGLWYCSNIVAAAPSFSLILSQNAAHALDGGYLLGALGCGDDGVAYCTTDNGHAAGNYLYGTGAMAQSGPLHIPNGAGQHSIRSGTSVRLGAGAGGVPQMRIYELDSAVWVSQYVEAVAGDPSPAVGFMNWGNDIYSYADGGVAKVLVYAGGYGPVISDGVNCLTVRTADDVLMNGAVQIATPLVAFGAARTFDGYCLGLSGYGEILACAAEGAASNFLAMRDTGGTWAVKDGDWVAVMGANYTGGNANVDATILTADV